VLTKNDYTSFAATNIYVILVFDQIMHDLLFERKKSYLLSIILNVGCG